MKIGKKEFKRVDFDNEFTLEQGEIGKGIFAEFLENLILLTGSESVEVKSVISSLDINFLCRVLAVSHFELIDGEWVFEIDNFESNVKLFKKLNTKQFAEVESTITDFFTFIMKFNNSVIQTFLAGMKTL